MKKVLLLLAVVFAFTLAMAAQETGAASTDQTQTTTTTKKSTHKKGSASGDMDNMKMGASGKQATLTGCLSKDANSDGMYTLTNGRRKRGVEVGPADKVKDHAGHQVKLTGSWGSAAAAGETGAEASSSKEKGERHFTVDSVTHISDTCSEAAGGGTKGMTDSETGKTSGKKGKKGSSTSTPQNPQ